MSEKIDLVSLPKKSFWKLSIPIIAFCIFDAIYGIVDMLWVSRISVEAFFALGVSIPIVSLIFSFGDSIGQGTNSLMSRFIGSGDYESAYNTLIHGLILSSIIWVLIVLCILFADGILYYLDKADSYILIFDYLIPIAVFAYIFILNNVFSETLQAEGNSTTPTVLMIASNILNIILDPIFIFNLNLGIKGAAYATLLSAFVVFIIFMFLYLSGRTKIPLSFKYFKYRGYILVEIFKVALPNFLDSGLWCFSASFINSILILTMGEMGPILYSVANKLKTLLIAPVRGYGRGLMSVTGHLFGAHKFEDLYSMFKYVLNISMATTLAVMIVFIFLRNYAFSLFSITGMESEVFHIAIGGTIIMMAIPFSMISSKMLDGFGKSMYSLLFTFLKIMFEMVLIYELSTVMSSGMCVLIGIAVSEILFAVVYYMFLRHLFMNFDEEYEDKETVRNFNKGDVDDGTSIMDDVREISTKSKVALIISLISMVFVVFGIFSIPIRLNNYPVLLSGMVALVIGSTSIYYMVRLRNPLVSIVGFISSSIIIFVFMGKYGYLSTLLFIVTGVLLLNIHGIVKLLKM